METSKFWFNNFKPDVEICVNDNKVLSLLKKTIMESELGIAKVEMVFDPLMSKILKGDAYYITLRKKKQLLNIINKCCNLDINLNTLNIQIHTDDKTYILLESPRTYQDNTLHHCFNVQQFYSFKNFYLRDNPYHTPSSFARSFCRPIYDDLRVFLSQTKTID